MVLRDIPPRLGTPSTVYLFATDGSTVACLASVAPLMNVRTFHGPLGCENANVLHQSAGVPEVLEAPGTALGVSQVLGAHAFHADVLQWCAVDLTSAPNQARPSAGPVFPGATAQTKSSPSPSPSLTCTIQLHRTDRAGAQASAVGDSAYPGPPFVPKNHPRRYQRMPRGCVSLGAGNSSPTVAPMQTGSLASPDVTSTPMS